MEAAGLVLCAEGDGQNKMILESSILLHLEHIGVVVCRVLALDAESYLRAAGTHPRGLIASAVEEGMVLLGVAAGEVQVDEETLWSSIGVVLLDVDLLIELWVVSGNIELLALELVGRRGRDQRPGPDPEIGLCRGRGRRRDGIESGRGIAEGEVAEGGGIEATGVFSWVDCVVSFEANMYYTMNVHTRGEPRQFSHCARQFTLDEIRRSGLFLLTTVLHECT